MLMKSEMIKSLYEKRRVDTLQTSSGSQEGMLGLVVAGMTIQQDFHKEPEISKLALRCCLRRSFRRKSRSSVLHHWPPMKRQWL